MKIFLVLYLMSTAYLSANDYRWSKGESSIEFVDKASIEIERVVKHKDNKFDKRVYKPLYYAPIWVGQHGLSSMGVELLDVVKGDKTLSPSMSSSKLLNKCRRTIKALASKGSGGMNSKVSLELSMNRLYQSYANYLITGGIDWRDFKNRLIALKESKKIEADWVTYNPEFTASSMLKAIISGASMSDEFEKIEQKRFHYAELRKYLIKYIDIRNSGKWMKADRYRHKIRVGNTSSIVPSVRNNLSLLGDLKNCSAPADPNDYDDCLEKGVKRFQLRNGVKATGVIDKQTYNLLTKSLANRIKLIRLNLDKMKRLRRKHRSIRMELNIPSFRLTFLDNDDLVDTIRVVVGKPNHPTPVFGNSVQYIVVNPWWKIPDSIVKNEMLKHLVKDPYYYERRGKVLHKTWDQDSERIDPGDVNWAKYKDNKKYIPYKFMQVPSSKNALGKIKFMFPNDFSVYIHDTPSKSLFFKTNRAFSHGCMRIQKPRELLKAFARYNPNIEVEEIMDQLKTTKNSTIGLKKKIPIDITYLTAFVDVYGNLNFRKDVYGYDKLMYKNYSLSRSNSSVKEDKGTRVKKKTTAKKIKKPKKRSFKKHPVAKTEAQILSEQKHKRQKKEPMAIAVPSIEKQATKVSDLFKE